MGMGIGRTLGLFATAVVLWIVFVLIEIKARYPLFHLSLLAYRNYSIGLGITMSYCIGYFAVTILLTLYLQGVHNLSPLESGLMLIPLSVPQLFIAPFGGRLADRFGPARMIFLGSLLIGLALLMLGQLGTQLSTMAVIIPLIIISVVRDCPGHRLQKQCCRQLRKSKLVPHPACSGLYTTCVEPLVRRLRWQLCSWSSSPMSLRNCYPGLELRNWVIRRTLLSML